jgi:hypothetical protein
LYYFHDSLQNTEALHSENEQYITSYSAQQSKSPESFQSTTFFNPKKSNGIANTLSTLNPVEFEAKANTNLAKNFSKSIKSLNKNKLYDDDYKVVNNFCDDDILTSHYYHNNKMKENRKGKKAKR